MTFQHWKISRIILLSPKIDQNGLGNPLNIVLLSPKQAEEWCEQPQISEFPKKKNKPSGPHLPPHLPRVTEKRPGPPLATAIL